MDNYYPRIRDLREDHDLTQQDVSNYLLMKPLRTTGMRFVINIPP